jgi:hypothetical protein
MFEHISEIPLAFIAGYTCYTNILPNFPAFPISDTSTYYHSLHQCTPQFPERNRKNSSRPF